LLVLDLSQLRNVTLDDESLMREVLHALVSESTQQIEELRRAVEQGDTHKCIRLAHNGHGACGNVGAASMADLFSRIEHQASDGDFGSCRSSLEELSIELEKLRRAAEAI
jgi:HPt (histidine-containing phosphotransfer) domain-containing protein